MHVSSLDRIWDATHSECNWEYEWYCPKMSHNLNVEYTQH